MTLENEEGEGPEGSDFTVIKLPEGMTFPFGGSMMLLPRFIKRSGTLWRATMKTSNHVKGVLKGLTFATQSLSVNLA